MPSDSTAARGSSQREVYVNGLEHVLERLAGRTGRLVYVSSTSVYGQHSGEIVDEMSICSPTTSNGMVCLEAEQLLSRFLLSRVMRLSREKLIQSMESHRPSSCGWRESTDQIACWPASRL